MTVHTFAVLAQAAAEDEVDLGAWASDNPLLAVLAGIGVLVVLVFAGRWLVERPIRLVVVVAAIGAAIAFGQAELIPFAAITFLVIGTLSAPYRWWTRRRGPSAPRQAFPDEPEPMPNRCTWPDLGPCPVHPNGHTR